MYMAPFLHEKSLYFIKKFLDDTFSNSVCAFASIRHVLLKILRRPMHPSPHLKFGGRTVSPSPPKSPPMT